MHETKMLIFAPHSIINLKLFLYVQLHICCMPLTLTIKLS